jgi:xylulokinase
MDLLGLDVGSSSVKAAVLRGGRLVTPVVRAFFKTNYAGPRAEVPAGRVLKAVAEAVGLLGARARRADVVGPTAMSPAWVAMDARGRALMPIVTHQDRRSVAEAAEIERRLGKARHLRLAGNRPFPGGISSTTWAWYLRHEPALMRKADLVGHLSTLLHREFTGARVIDPSNASFTGLYSTLDQSGWADELCDAAGASRRLLPEVVEADRIGGRVTRAAAARYGLAEGTPVMVGLIDTSAAMLLAGPRPGQLLNVCGSTDVLSACTDDPRPHERVLTRALGVGPRWMAVSTIAAAGSALFWAKELMFAEWPMKKFQRTVRALALGPAAGASSGAVRFEPYLAGDRASIEQRQAALSGLTLSTTRKQILSAVIEALVEASAERLDLLKTVVPKLRRTVVVSGGAEERLDQIMHRDWPGRWTFKPVTEASLRGLATLEPRD